MLGLVEQALNEAELEMYGDAGPREADAQELDEDGSQEQAGEGGLEQEPDNEEAQTPGADTFQYTGMTMA